MDSKKIIKDDILCYKKNKIASMFALLGLVFTALYFTLLYSVNNTFFYSIYMGLSVIVTLVLLLVAFLSSESVKNYRKTYCIVLLVLAALNVGRIFYYPLNGLKEKAFEGSVYFWTKMPNGAIFSFLVIYLVASATCYVAAAVFGYLYAIRLEKHLKAVESGKIDVKAALKEEDATAEQAVAQNKEIEANQTVAQNDVHSDIAENEENTDDGSSEEVQ